MSKDTYHVVTLPTVPGLPAEHELRLGTTRIASGTGPGVKHALTREAEKRNNPAAAR